MLARKYLFRVEVWTNALPYIALLLLVVIKNILLALESESMLSPPRNPAPPHIKRQYLSGYLDEKMVVTG
jgi:hypothetical protein